MSDNAKTGTGHLGPADDDFEAAARQAVNRQRLLEGAVETAAASGRLSIPLPPVVHTLRGDEVIEVAFTDHDFCGLVAQAMDGRLFGRGSSVCEIRDGSLRNLRTETLSTVLGAHLEFHKTKAVHPKDGDSFVARDPRSPTRDLLSRLSSSLSTMLPEITGVVQHPAYVPGWKLAKPGLNAGGIYSVLEQESHPDDDAEVPAAEARKELDDLVVDFPFATDGDKANLIALMLTVLVRPAIGGNIPLFAVSAGQARVGKTLLVQSLVAELLLGQRVRVTPWQRNQESNDKRLTAALRSGDSLILLDNVRGIVDSPLLEAALTSASLSVRTLFTHDVETIENGSIFVMTNNNAKLSRDLVYRCIDIRLQSPVADPAARRSFNHPDIFAHVRACRSRILALLVGMVERWKAAGRPGGKVLMGGFEEWSIAIGGVLAANGIDGFLSDWHAKAAEADDGSVEIAEFVEKVLERVDTEPFTVTEIVPLARDCSLFGGCFEKADEASVRSSIGLRLGKVVGHVVMVKDANYRLDRLDRTSASRRYQLVRTDVQPQHASPQHEDE